MPKAYWIVQLDVHDPDGFRAYIRANALPFAKYGARFLVRGGSSDRVEGHFRSRLVVIEFDDLETARACYASPEYAEAIRIRQAHSTGDVAIVEGCEEPQPGGDAMGRLPDRL